MSLKDLYPIANEWKALSEETKKCYLQNNIEMEKIKKELKTYNRKINATPLDGNFLYSSILSQISHDPKYTAAHLRKQVALFLAKYPEVFFDNFKPWLEDQSVESYIRNMYDGHSYGDESAAAVIGVMWNIHITIISPNLPPVHVFHNRPEKLDVIIVHNGQDSPDGDI